MRKERSLPSRSPKCVGIFRFSWLFCIPSWDPGYWLAICNYEACCWVWLGQWNPIGVSTASLQFSLFTAKSYVYDIYTYRYSVHLAPFHSIPAFPIWVMWLIDKDWRIVYHCCATTSTNLFILFCIRWGNMLYVSVRILLELTYLAGSRNRVSELG